MVILNMFLYRFLHFLIFLFASFVCAQSFQFDNYDRSRNMFHNNSYSNAISSLNFIVKTKEKQLSRDYLVLLSSLRKNQKGADRQLPYFIKKYPLSTLGNVLPFDLANFYFENQKYSYALKWYQNLNENQLTKSLRNQFNFNKGYSLFHVKRYKAAKPFLDKVKSVPRYISDAHYYLGHISYQLNDYENANANFDLVDKDSKQNDLAYFQVEMNYKLGRFQKACELGVDLISKINESERSELSKIIGESYFNLKKYDEALSYLKDYHGNNGKWSNNDFYQLGYTYFVLGDYSNAIDQFNKIIDNSNALAQNAFYHLGDSYLKVNKKIEALNAFKTASEMKYDEIITEDALLQYAKLGYESGNPFESSQKVMIRFINLFPKNKNVEEVEYLLASSYKQKGNYDAAISILESGGRYKDNDALQSVLYLKGISLYDSGDYSTAELFFSRAIKIERFNDIAAKSLYWKGQSQFELGSYSSAQKSYNDYLSLSIQLNQKLRNVFWYEIGYTYFKLKNYPLAIDCFIKQLSNETKINPSYEIDTYLRLADSYFANSNYWKALDNYNASIDMSEKDISYPLFQKALSYGFLQKIENKIKVLIDLSSEDQDHFIVDKSLYELAKTYTSIKEFDSALEVYNSLIKRFPNSNYLSRSYLNRGLILFNTERLLESKEVLELVVEKFRNDRITTQALNSLKEISIELGEVDVFSEWLKSQNIRSFSEGDLASSAFEAAEKFYFDKKNRLAERQIKDFIIRYPDYSGLSILRYYLADIYFQNKDWENAIINYDYILELKNHEYTERSLVNSSLALQNMKDSQKLISRLLRLKETAFYSENKRFALYNLMKEYFKVDDYSNSIMLSEEVLGDENLDSNVRWDALEINARSALILKDSSRAFIKFKELENSPKKTLAAEANFYKAFQLSKQKNYDLSNKVIADLSKFYGSSEYWNARSILLMANNFKNLNDYFQSIYLLETLIENFTKFPEIFIKAQEMLVKVKSKVSDQNSSVELNSKTNE